MSSLCWSLPHLFSLPVYHNTKHHLGQHDLLQEDTVHPEPLPQEPLPKTSGNAIRSECNAKESLSHLNYESAGNLRPKHSHTVPIMLVVVLFNKDNFHSDITVESIYFHDNRNGQHQAVREGQSQSGWVLQAVISRASFCRIPRNGKPFFTMMSLYINITCAKNRGIAKNLLLAVRIFLRQQQVDSVAGDFNGAAWRRQSGSDPRHISIIDETFVNTNLLVPPDPKPLWRPGGVSGEWSDVCGFF